MKRILSALALATLVLVSAPASTKTRTIRLEISGQPLAKPLEITDAAVLKNFNIWNGPSVRVNGQPIHMDPANQEQMGAFIDWPRGIASTGPAGRPGLQRYQVIFHQTGPAHMHEWHRRYVVTYEYDPAAKGGYIYLPGHEDVDLYQRNTFSLVHGIEGNWFHSSAAWERLVRPLIEQARAVPPQI